MGTLINPFALHYFLWFAALTSIYGYISVYAEHYANASPSQYGLLGMVLPFVTILTKLYFCSLADRHQAHRSCFVIFLIIALIGYGSFGVLPFFIDPQPKDQGLNHTAWLLICIMTSVGTIAMSVICCLSDAFAMNSSKKNKTTFGRIRVWGTLGWGLSSVLLSFINQPPLPQLVPGLIMLMILLAIDIIVAVSWSDKTDFQLEKSSCDVHFEEAVSASSRCRETGINISTKLASTKVPVNHYGAAQINYTNFEAQHQDQDPEQQLSNISSMSTQWFLFKEVARRRRSIFRFMILFTISGALTSLQWSYFFLYLNKIYASDFTFISSLSMVVQSLLGELPFFLLSNSIIKWLGRSHTLSISIVAIGLRYILYEYLLPNGSMYFVFLTEAFQGPCFGLFYVVMTEVGLDYSECEAAIVAAVEKGVISNDPEHMHKLRQALRATTQSLMSACYEGLGQGIGSIVGGLIIEYYGFSKLWLWSALIAAVFGAINFLIEIFNLPILVDERPIMMLKI